MAKFTCQHCHQPFESAKAVPGTQISCPVCGKLTLAYPAPVPAPIEIPSRAKAPKMVIAPIEKPEPIALSEVAALARDLVASVETVIVGKHEQVKLVVAALLAEGHLLLEDVPGVAKTMLARALAQSAGCSFKRIQCTPDLQPSDILGENYLDPQSGRMEFRFGPIFSQLVLVDEINRSSPRTQAALLEAMGEGMNTVERVSYRLQRPYMVIATQNPIEQAGTFTLPEAQMDRFLFRLSLGYPELKDEKLMCERFQLAHPIDSLKPMTTPDRITECQQAVREVQVSPAVCDYLLALVRATRRHPALLLGASPRASLGIYRAAQAAAAMAGSNQVSADDVKKMAQTVLPHRVLIRREDQFRDLMTGTVIANIVAQTSLPD